jgi:hypothetical protein
MKKALVGYTGFVGSNLAAASEFSGLYNSKNIESAYGTSPDLLIYSGVRAEKFLANNDPDMDLQLIKNAMDSITRIQAKKVVLISTIDVYKNPVGVDEETLIETNNLHPYGLHRYYLEKWVEENIKEHLIVRLPGLYGKNIKKNFLFDLIHIIPSMLNSAKYSELIRLNPALSDYYLQQSNGFYKCRDLSRTEKSDLKSFFNSIGFSALNFTDSRGVFQFYNLSFLFEHIQKALDHGISKLNLAAEPVSVSDIYHYIRGSSFINEIAAMPPRYDFKSMHADLFQGKNGYIFDKSFVMDDIKAFVDKESAL